MTTQQEEIGLQHYFEVLWRRKWPMGVVFVIVLTLSVIGVFLSKTTYQVQSKVAIRSSFFYRPSMLSFAPGTDAPATTMSGETYVEVINGLPFAQQVADHLLREGHPLDAGTVRGALKAEFQEPDLIKIQARSEVPELAVTMANAAADVFVEATRAQIRDELLKGRDSVLLSLKKADTEAQELEEQIARFRREIGSIDLSGEMLALREKIAVFEQSRGEQITKLEIAQARRQELVNLARAGSAGGLYLDDPSIDEYRRLQQSVTESRTRYTDDHPALKNLLSQLKRIESRLQETISRAGSNLSPEAFLTLKEDLATTDAEIANLQTAIGSWTRQIDEIKAELSKYPDRVAQLQSLESKSAAARESSKTWSSRLEEIDFKASKVPANADLVDRAVRPMPTIGKMTLAILGLMVSLMLSVGTGFLLEFGDTTLRNPEEVAELGLGYLGSIVKLKEPNQVLFAEGRPVNQAAEAFTRIYSNIKFAEVEGPLHSILVTSARKGEGKSTSLVNLSCAVAAAGRRVIIVDTDLRNPTLQRVLGTKHRTGLTSVLAGEAALDDAIRATSHPGLSILPTGPIPPNPAELLHSQAMKDVIQNLERRADLVIFDSPPTLLVADAMLLAGELDAALIVAESGGVSRKAVQQVKESLEVAKARILGVILNKIQDSPGAYYNYYSYYTPAEDREGRDEPEEAQVGHTWLKGIRKTMGGRR